MRFVVHLAARAGVVAAIAALPLVAVAQTQTPSAAQPNPAAEHLSAARAALNKVLNSPAPNADAVKKLAEIKTEYLALEKAASTASPAWAAHYKTIDRLVGGLLGPAPAAGVAGAVGTSGTTDATGVAANPDMAANLATFHTELSAFAKAMAAVAPAPSSTATTASAAAPPAAAAAPPPAATPAPATVSSATAPSSPAPAATASPAVGSDAAVLSKLESVSTMLEAALKANADTTSGPVPVDRAMLEQMKLQLEQAKQALKKQ